MTTNPTNRDRAEWANEALAVFTRRTFGGDEPGTMHRADLEDAIGDLVADLFHLARAEGIDPRAILRRAVFHFDADEHEEANP